MAIVAQLPVGNSDPIIRRGGSQLAVHLADEMHYGSVLLLATGSEDHIAGLRARAAVLGMTLGEDGLRKGGKLVADRSDGVDTLEVMAELSAREATTILVSQIILAQHTMRAD